MRKTNDVLKQLYSGERSPYGPCTFLQSMWLSLKELAGYAQQDAHEFFISALNQIHADSEGSLIDICFMILVYLRLNNEPLSLDHSMDNCDCVVHQTFAGVLQSNVTCLKCGNVSSAYDPMLDISLDLLPSEKKKKHQIGLANDNLGKLSKTSPSANDKREVPNSESNQPFFAARRTREPNSLADCLDR
jgi:ubiquitin carboxyl-terminal hydrolase 22/27/51